MLELKEIYPVGPGRSYFAIGRQPIVPPIHNITRLRYGKFFATKAQYRLTADTMWLIVTIQTIATSKLANPGSLFRLCQLPADTGL
jgi:hypothetical protein